MKMRESAPTVKKNLFNKMTDRDMQKAENTGLAAQSSDSEAQLFENLKSSGLDQSVADAALRRLVESIPTERLAALVLFGIVEIEDLAGVLGIDTQTIRNRIARRSLPSVRLGRRNVVLVKSMREWLQKKEIKPHGSF